MTRRRITLLVLALLLAAGTVTYLCLPKEPRYRGRTLSSWLEGCARNRLYLFSLSEDFPNSDRATTQSAIRAMGTNALPFLIKWSFAHDSGTKEKWVDWINRHIPFRYFIWRAEGRRYAAEVGFELLGEKAKPACPIFLQWTFDKNEQRRALGLRCLISADADDATMLPVYRRMINDENHYVREHAAYEYFRHFRRQAVTDDLYEKFPQLHLQQVRTIDRSTNHPSTK